MSLGIFSQNYRYIFSIAPFLNMVCPYWHCLIGRGRVSTIARIGWATFYSTPKWAISYFREVRTLARMVYTFFSSFWQCQRPGEKMGPKKCPTVPLAEGSGGGLGLKLYGQWPYLTPLIRRAYLSTYRFEMLCVHTDTPHSKKGASLTKMNSSCVWNSWQFWTNLDVLK